MTPAIQAMFFGRALTQTTVTLASSQTWTAPAGVTMVNLQGKGSNGTAPTTAATSSNIDVVNYRTDTSTGAGYTDWSNFDAGRATLIANDLDADGVVAFNRQTYTVWPDGTYTFGGFTVINITNGVPGTATVELLGGWDITGGPITSSGRSRVAYSSVVPGVAGTASTGFGKTFPGGAANTAAPITPFNNVAVVPGTGYPLVIPSGGSIQIVYFS